MTESKTKKVAPRSPTRLVDVLRALPARELEALATRIGATLDRAKRIDPPMQIARLLASPGELRDLQRFSSAAVQVIRRIADAGGVLLVEALPQGLDVLVARGIVHARMQDGGYELVLPTALLLQVPPWEGEDPRSLRVLLAQAPSDTLSAIAAHYLGKPALPPLVLALELAWDALNTPEGIAREVAALPVAERRLLVAVEHVGGEVDTEDLLDLEREPLRLHHATGAAPSRRGVGFSLERRGMLIPVHPNRHVVPTEVAAVVGASDATVRERKRSQIRAFLLDRDHEPRRAKFSSDPVPLVLALSLTMREWGAEVREGAGTPRSLLLRLSQRFGRDLEAVNLLAALSRAIGLWDASAMTPTVSPGSLQVFAVARALFGVWRKGGVWDEARPEPEVLRVPHDAREAGPIGVVRDIVFDALDDLDEGRWVPFEALANYLREDARTAGVARLLRRWADRVGLEAPTPTDVAQRIVLESLPALGIVDLGEADIDEEGSHDAGPLVRLTRAGRLLMQGSGTVSGPDASVFAEESTLRVGGSAIVASVMALHPCTEVGKVGTQIELIVTPATLARAIGSGVEADVIRATLQAVAPLSDTLAKMLDQMTVILGRGAYVAASGFLWCDDAEVREMLRTRKQTSDLFLEPSPPGGLLVVAGKTMEVVARRCRTLGVEITAEGQVIRARSSMPPAVSESMQVARRLSSAPARGAVSTRVRRSKASPAG